MVTEIETGLHKIAGTIGMCVGGLVVLVGLAIGVFNWRQHTSMERVLGTVVKYEKGMKGPGPYVRYVVNEQAFVASGQVKIDGRRAVKRGEAVGVLYYPDHPEKGRLDLFLEFWFSTILVLVCGTGMTLIATLLRFGPGNKILINNR